MTQQEAFDFLCRTARGIAEMFGSGCETLVHDMTKPSHPIVAIFNGHVSGRTAGSTEDIYGANSPADKPELIDRDYVNHLVVTGSGKKIKSSTFNLTGEGYSYALGINFDFTQLDMAGRVLEGLLAVNNDLQSAISQTGGEGQVAELFEECLAPFGKTPLQLSKQERVQLTAMLREKGFFQLQKSVPYLSERLGVSRYTIYKDLKEVDEG